MMATDISEQAVAVAKKMLMTMKQSSISWLRYVTAAD